MLISTNPVLMKDKFIMIKEEIVDFKCLYHKI